MIIVEVMGGLGNQMQQYALYRKLETLGKDAKNFPLYTNFSKFLANHRLKPEKSCRIMIQTQKRRTITHLIGRK